MTDQLHLFDPPAAIAARDAALAKVLPTDSPWMVQVLDALTPEFKKNHLTFTGETLRISLSLKVPQPHHHNAWGALIKTLLKRKIIVPTGRWVSMATKTSHARQTRLYFWA